MGRPRCKVAGCIDDRDCPLCDEWVMKRKMRENAGQKKMTDFTACEVCTRLCKGEHLDSDGDCPSVTA